MWFCRFGGNSDIGAILGCPKRDSKANAPRATGHEDSFSF